MIEYELTYLAKFLPEQLDVSRFKEYVDIYFPVTSAHPTLRLRRRGSTHEMTKKTMITGTDSSEMNEATIPLTAEEYEALAHAPGNRVRKLRYEHDIAGRTAEIDVFQDDLAGLVLIDFEFSSTAEKAQFTMPDICLADVTQEAFVAGGMLAGKSYADIATDLARYNYQKLTV